jgi:hypothetical protein
MSTPFLGRYDAAYLEPRPFDADPADEEDRFFDYEEDN